MENLLVALNAVVPFMIYLGLGYLIKIIKAGDEAFLNRLNSMVFKVFFPVMLFYNFYTIDSSQDMNGFLVLVITAAVLIVTGITFAAVNRTALPENRKGVVTQAIFRGNMALYALPLAESVLGDAGKLSATVAVAVSVPLFNILAIIVLEYYTDRKTGVWSLIKKVFTNPLLIGSFVGLIFMILKIRLPSFIVKPVSAISSATTPLALMTLGGTLHFSSLKKDKKIISVVLLIRMVVLPILMIFVTTLFSLTSADRFVLLTLFACPVAVSSYTMAANMGGDRALAGEFVAVSTVFSLLTIFVFVLVLKMLAWI